MIHISRRTRETFIDIGSGTEALLMMVVVDDKPVANIALKPSQALRLANELIKHADKVKNTPAPSGRDTNEGEE